MRLLNYLLSHPPHAPYLTVSLYTLRQYWDGPVRIHTWPYHGSSRFAKRICEDERLGPVEYVEREPRERRRDDYLFDKPILVQQIKDADSCVLLDADTIVTGPIDELFESVEKYGFVGTQFNDWTTQGPIMQRRIKNMRNIDDIDQTLVEEVLRDPWPAMNVGVFGSRPDSQMLDDWIRWTFILENFHHVFIADEVAIQPLQVKYVPCGEMIVIDRHNQSPRTEINPDARIWHGHGNCWTKPEKSNLGHAKWYPLYWRCMMENIGGIADWKDDADNKWLKRLEDG